MFVCLFLHKRPDQGRQESTCRATAAVALISVELMRFPSAPLS